MEAGQGGTFPETVVCESPVFINFIKSYKFYCQWPELMFPYSKLHLGDEKQCRGDILNG